MDYPLKETPFVLVPFKEMNKTQAKQYFNWFMDEKSKRIQQLQDYINNETDGIVLDYTPKSLIPLWEWFENKIEWVDKTPEEIQQESERIPERFKGSIFPEVKKRTILTLALGADIATYFADVLVKNNPSVYWGCPTKPKSLVGVNQPQFYVGGECVLPTNLIDVCMRKSTKKRNKNKLYETYQTWSGIVQKRLNPAEK